MSDALLVQPPVDGATAPGRGLDTLVSLPRSEFAEHVWDRRPHLSRATDLPPATHGFGPDAVDELLSRRALRTPFLRMARDGATIDERRFTLGGGVGAGVSDQVSEDRVLGLFAEGASIVLQGLHRAWEPVADTARDVARDLGHPVQVNAYVTPPQNQGFDDHYDVHDVFVVQVAGTKRWRVRPPVLDRPLRSQPWTDRRDAVREAATRPPELEVTLAPGDCLYLPRGWLHAATALGETSIHLTVGVHVWTLRGVAADVLAGVAARLDEDPALRAALPVGVDLADAATDPAVQDLVRRHVAAALDDLPAEALAATLAGRARAAQRAEPLSVLAQSRAVSTGHRTWRVRAGLEPRWEGPVLVTRVGRLAVDPGDVPRVDDVVDGRADPATLGADLTRRLALAGMLLPVSP